MRFSRAPTCLAFAIAASGLGCATIQPVTGTPLADWGPATSPVELCVLIHERNERRVLEGVAELSLSPWHQAIATVVVRRPNGLTLIDPAFGWELAEDLKGVPPWFRVLSGDAKGKVPTVAGLEAAGMSPRQVQDTLLTHAHWDHAGALRDLPLATHRMSTVERQFVESLTSSLDHGVMRQHFERSLRRVEAFDFDGPGLLRFDASKDLYGDGSVIAVPLFGHTPGSTGYLVRDLHGQRWLFIGDATWTLRGVEKPGHKTVFWIDEDRARTGETIARLHALSQEHPEITVVPAHDAAALDKLPPCQALSAEPRTSARTPTPAP